MKLLFLVVAMLFCIPLHVHAANKCNTLFQAEEIVEKRIRLLVRPQDKSDELSIVERNLEDIFAFVNRLRIRHFSNDTIVVELFDYADSSTEVLVQSITLVKVVEQKGNQEFVTYQNEKFEAKMTSFGFEIYRFGKYYVRGI